MVLYIKYPEINRLERESEAMRVWYTLITDPTTKA